MKTQTTLIKWKFAQNSWDLNDDVRGYGHINAIVGEAGKLINFQIIACDLDGQWVFGFEPTLQRAKEGLVFGRALMHHLKIDPITAFIGDWTEFQPGCFGAPKLYATREEQSAIVFAETERGKTYKINLGDFKSTFDADKYIQGRWWADKAGSYRSYF